MGGPSFHHREMHHFCNPEHVAQQNHMVKDFKHRHSHYSVILNRFTQNPTEVYSLGLTPWKVFVEIVVTVVILPAAICSVNNMKRKDLTTS